MYHKVDFVEKKAKRLSSKLLLPVLLITTLALIVLVYLANHRRYSVVLPVNQSLHSHDKSQSSGTANEKVDAAPHVDIIVPDSVYIGNDEDDVHKVVTGSEKSSISTSIGWDDYPPELSTETVSYTSTEGYQTYSTLPESHPTTSPYTITGDLDGESPNDDKSFLQKLFNWNWGHHEVDEGDLSTEDLNLTDTSVNNTDWQSSQDSYPVEIFNTTDDFHSNQTLNLTASLQESSQLESNSIAETVDLITNAPPKAIVPTTSTVPKLETSLPRCFNLSSSSLKDIITNALRIARISERESMKDFERTLKSNSDLGVIDAMGGLSVYSLIAVGMGRKVVVLEPNHDCADQLRQVLGMNGLLDLVTIKETALLHQSGYGTFMSLHGKYFVSSVDDPNIIRNNSEEHMLLKTTTLDDLAVGLPFKKAVLCVDVVAFQPSIFNSASSLFETIKFFYVFMLWDYDSNNDQAAASTISFLGRQNFEPRERLKNGFGLIPTFYRYWPDNVIWVNKQPW